VAAATGPVKQTKVGVSVTGNLGEKPALTIPSGSAPTALTAEVLTAGTGPVVTKGQTLVANYLGETWDAKDGKPNIFDNSYDRLAPAAFAIGAGQVIPGWDETLVGQKAGTRLLLTIPPAKAYGASPSASNELSGKTLLFVVDVLGGLDKTASATGTELKAPAGFPAVTSASGKKPVVTSVSGVTPGTGTDSKSTLLIKGGGAPIDAKKSLALQIVQTDTATGKQTQETWGTALQVVPAANVLSIATSLTGATVGSRVLVVTPQSTARPSVVLVLDVIGQY
jgi:peptidylprolyl isomerase